MITNEMARLIQEADVKVHFDLDDGVLVISNLDKFAALVAAAERDRLEPAFERLETLMKIREGQPNKPCCLAEREACAKVVETYDVASGMNGAPHIAMIFKDCAAAIRARGNT